MKTDTQLIDLLDKTNFSGSLKDYMKIFILFISLLLTSCANPTVSGSLKTSANVCAHLSPVKQVNDLMKQFYQNINSDCLFTAKTEDLQRAWGVPVFEFSTSIFKQTPEIIETQKKIHALINQKQPIIVLRHVGFSTWNQVRPHPQITIMGDDVQKLALFALLQNIKPADKIQIGECHPSCTSTAYIWHNAAHDVARPHLVIEQSERSARLSPKITLYRHGNESNFPFFQPD